MADCEIEERAEAGEGVEGGDLLKETQCYCCAWYDTAVLRIAKDVYLIDSCLKALLVHIVTMYPEKYLHPVTVKLMSAKFQFYHHRWQN